MSYRITFTAGLEKGADGFYLDEGMVADAVSTVRRQLAARFGGYTETDSVGGWIDDDGYLVEERGKRWVCLASMDRKEAEKAGRELAGMIAAELRQACVVMEIERVSSAFVGPTTTK